MPQTRDIALEELAEAGDALSITATRVDSAHSIGDALASLPPIREMPVDLAINDLVRVEGAVQLQAQAEQLAAHLKQRQVEIDNREGQLRTRLAEFEQEVREARLWLAQRDAELNDREKRLNERECELPSPNKSPSPAKSSATSLPAAELPPVRASDVGSEKRRPDLSPHASWVAETQWEERKKALSRQSEELDRRRVALEKFRDEIAIMHHEALEMRLAGEELQAQLRASLGVAAADESLKAIRERLARSYQNEIDRLTCRQHELEWLKCDLAAEAGKLERRYAELKDWVAQHRVQVARDKSEVRRY